MSSFKTKNKVKKKGDYNTRVTLDAIHNNKMKEFTAEQNDVKKNGNGFVVT